MLHLFFFPHGTEYGSGMEDARLQQGDEDRGFQALPDLIVDHRTSEISLTKNKNHDSRQDPMLKERATCLDKPSAIHLSCA